MTINQLLQNPTGKASAYMYSRQVIIDDLNYRYYNLIKKHKHFEYRLYQPDKTSYLMVFRIPSEKHDNVYYDTAIEFVTADTDMAKDSTLNRYDTKLFSNSPSFVFTYAYVYNKENMLIEILKHKLGKLALTKEPRIRNPLESKGFEKSLYYTAKYIKEHRLTDKGYIAPLLHRYSKRKLVASIRNIDTIMREIKSAQQTRKTKSTRKKKKKRKK